MINLKLLDKEIKESGITQVELADAIPCSRSTLLNIRKGNSLPSFYILTRLIEELKLNQTEVNRIFFSNIKLEGGENE